VSSLAGFDGCSQGQALHISVDEPLRSSRVGARLHSPEVSPVQSRHPARAPDGWVGARSKQPPEAAFSCPRMAAVCKGVNPKGCLLLDGEEPRSSSRSIALRCPQKAATCGAARELCRARVVETLAQAAPQKWQGCARDCVGNAEDGSQ